MRLWLLATLFAVVSATTDCFFPETEVRPFFFQVNSSIPVGTIVADSLVDPPEADLFIASIRSDNLPNVNFTGRFELKSSKKTGRFELVAVQPLSLPSLPSSVKETTLFITVFCNGRPFPLMSVHVDSVNTVPPVFIGEPYTVRVPESFTVGSILDLPVIAIDWDPSTFYDVDFSIENNPNFVVEKTGRQQPNGIEDINSWTREQMPAKLSLRMISDGAIADHLVILAKDNGKPSFSSKTTIRLVRESESNLVESTNERKELVSTSTIRPRAHHSKIVRMPAASSFASCYSAVNLPENSPINTVVYQFKVENGDEKTRVKLIDPDGTFAIDSKTGEVVVADNQLVDRERFSSIEILAQIEGASMLSPCPRARLRVHLIDENDNRPVFEHENYVFILDASATPNTEFAVLKARDIDDAENGHVFYRLLNDSSPFRLIHRGRDAYLITYRPIDDNVDTYNLQIEARDNGVPEKNAIAQVEIRIVGRKAKIIETVKENIVDENHIEAKTTTEATTQSPTTTTMRKTTERYEEIVKVETNKLQKESPALRGVASTNEREPVPLKDQRQFFRSVRPSFQVKPTNISPQKEVENTDEQAIDQEENFSEEFGSSSTESSSEVNFAFTSPHYYYELFGRPAEDVVFGFVRAEPNPQMYGIDKKVIGKIKVDADVGELSVGKRALSEGNITFHVSATDGVRTAQTTVTVRVEPTKLTTDALPRFEQTYYEFHLDDDVSSRVVGIVRAFHAAAHPSDNRLVYDIVTDNADLPFSIQESSGEVASERPLNSRDKNAYDFEVRACLSTPLTQCNSVAVRILIGDELSPTFEKEFYTASLPSDYPVGSTVLQLRASNAVRYRMKDPNHSFSIDQVTGVIRSSELLTESVYDFDVEALTNSGRKREVPVHIDVQGTNPSAPAFDQKRYDVEVKAPVREGSVVAAVRATDPDPGDEGTISYRLIDADQFPFSINERTGVVSAHSRIGTQDGPFDVMVEATDNGAIIKRKSNVLLHIDVVGGSSIEFLPLPATIFISSEKALGSSILRASARSALSSPLEFKILEDTSPFDMDGDLMRVVGHLFPGKMEVTIRAENGQAFVDHRLEVVVMADRDKYPVFPQLTYDFDIPMDEKMPMTIHKFNAVVSNGTLLYSFFPIERTPSGLHIDARTGDLMVTQEFVSQNAPVFVVVRATNMRFPEFFSDVGVALNIVSERAQLRFPQTIYRFEVHENNPKDLQLDVVEAFPRDPEIKYSIQPTGTLGIHSNGTVFVMKELDLENMNVNNAGQMNFIVKATKGREQASAKIQLQLVDENEFPPVFSKHMIEGKISEGAVPGTVIARLTAHDKDFSEGNHLLYKVVGGSGRDLVFIQEDGTIILGDATLDHEQQPEFDVEVEVYDRSGNKDKAVIHVMVEDANDNPPVFTQNQMTWNVKEGDFSSTFFVEANDQDSGLNKEISFRIVSGNEDDLFQIEAKSANQAHISLKSPLNYEEKKEYDLTIEATDNGKPPRTSTAVVHVKVSNDNDSPPALKSTIINQKTPISLPIGFPIVTISATDPDGDYLSFTLRECPGLSIDPLGIVSFNIPVSKRKEGEIVCRVEVSDGVHVSNGSIRLDIYNDVQPTVPVNRAPVFGKKEYDFTINENANFIGKVDAADPDGDESFLAIQPAEFREIFAIDVNNGRISLKVPIEQLNQSHYSFLVTAEDWNKPVLSSMANVKVHNPALTRTSSSPSPTPAPTESTPKIESSTEWAISSTTILKSTTTQRPHDEPVEIGEQLGPNPVVEPVIKFHRPSYVFAIRSDSPPGTYLGQVLVTYRDGVSFSIIGDGRIIVDSDGRLKTADLFDHAEQIEQNIIATREGRTVASVPMTLHVIEISENEQKTSTTTQIPIAPSTTRKKTEPSPTLIPEVPEPNGFSFDRPMYFAFVPEGSNSNGMKVLLKPNDLNTNAVEPVRYELMNAESVPFYLEANGQLLMFDVDRENSSSYMLDVRAIRGNDVATTQINVTILDVNDNYPVFEEHPTTFGIWNDAQLGDIIYTFKAKDADSGENGVVRYELGGEAAGLFSLDPNTGDLQLVEALPVSDELRLIVTARDFGRPALKTHHQVSIKIFDSKKPSPSLPITTDGVLIPSGSPAGYLIATIIAGPNVVTSRSQERIRYGLVDDHDGLFKIESDGRLIMIRHPKAQEVGRMYQLNVTANNSYGSDSTLVNILLESDGVETSSSSSTPYCLFDRKVYEAAIMENDESRPILTRVQANCDGVRYMLEPHSEEFSIDSKTGEVIAVRPIDRERRSQYTLFVTALSSRKARDTDGIIQEAKEHLRENQALVVIHVQDENDNSPEFLHAIDGRLIVHADATAELGANLLRLHARDPDETARLEFGIAGIDDESDEAVTVNRTTGFVSLKRSMESISSPVLKFTATVSDGLHVTPISLEIHKLSSTLNVVRLTSEKPPSELDDHHLQQYLGMVTGTVTRIVKKEGVDENGKTKSFVYVYAVDRKTHRPLPVDDFLDLLMQNAETLQRSPSQISQVSKVGSETTPSLSATDVLLLILALATIALLFAVCCCLSSLLKKRRTVAGHEYIVESQLGGPRPYDVEELSRQTAQTVLASRTLLPAKQIEVAVSPAFADVSTNRCDSTEHFKNSVRERPSLLQSAMARHRIQPGVGSLAADVDIKS